MTFDDQGSLPKISEIKICLQEIDSLGDTIGVSIFAQRNLTERIKRLSYSMFCYNKLRLKTFTICGDNKLRTMRIVDEEGGISLRDTLVIYDYLNDHLLEAFSELVAHSYLSPRPQAIPTKQRLFCVQVFSRYSNQRHYVFFYEYGGDLFFFTDRTTDIKLIDILKDIFYGRTNSDDGDGIESYLQELIPKLSAEGTSFVQQQMDLLTCFNAINTYIASRYDFISGAITFLDFLAWKGLWQSSKENNALKIVSELIDEFRSELHRLSGMLFPHMIDIPLSTLISISDTIAFFTPKVLKVSECELLKLHAQLCKFIIEKCVKNMFPIRGAITYGEYNIINNIMIGPGIDECASWHETGDWIGVHFSPTAQIHWYKEHHGISTDEVISGYKIPLKNGLSSENCVKWNISICEYNALALHTKALLPEIAGKYSNTFRFLHDKVWGEEDSHGEK